MSIVQLISIKFKGQVIKIVDTVGIRPRYSRTKESNTKKNGKPYDRLKTNFHPLPLTPFNPEILLLNSISTILNPIQITNNVENMVSEV